MRKIPLMGNLIPGEVLIYERHNNIIYARYQNRPEIPRWEVGRTTTKSDYEVYRDIMKLSETNSTLKKQLDKLKDIYYLIKSEE